MKLAAAIAATVVTLVAGTSVYAETTTTYYDFSWTTGTSANLFNGVVKDDVEGRTYERFTLNGHGPLRLDAFVDPSNPLSNMTSYRFGNAANGGSGVFVPGAPLDYDNFGFTTGLTGAPPAGIHGLSSGKRERMDDVVGDPASPDSFTLTLFMAGNASCDQALTNSSFCNGFADWQSTLTGHATREADEPSVAALAGLGLIALLVARRRGRRACAAAA